MHRRRSLCIFVCGVAGGPPARYPTALCGSGGEGALSRVIFVLGVVVCTAFRRTDAHQTALRIAEYSVASPTLEEAFIRIGNGFRPDGSPLPRRVLSAASSRFSDVDADVESGAGTRCCPTVPLFSLQPWEVPTYHTPHKSC